MPRLLEKGSNHLKEEELELMMMLMLLTMPREAEDDPCSVAMSAE